MLKRFFALAAALVVVGTLGVAEARTRRGDRIEQLPANSRILIMQRTDVQLSILTAAGVPEPREDWSIAGRNNLARSLEATVTREQHVASALDPQTAMEGRTSQIIRLHDAVGGDPLTEEMILTFIEEQYGARNLFYVSPKVAGEILRRPVEFIRAAKKHCEPTLPF